ncbi:hypothetical protein TEA_014218 [Camellia sinensis var. sinensis]|uniref:Uncharacterized protein n=1 Tax=Camellia sinensis var. sinensis TaxID=542762 RepID=A0A4S4EE16_CAMSN|nr:hypothetical protein TEA_014218 [Camellia sinensis var. sinensis]
MSEGGKSRGFAAVVGGQQPSAPPPQYYYGTFQGVANYYPPPPHAVMGFPQPAPPAGSSAIPHPPYYSLGYQTVPVKLLHFHKFKLPKYRHIRGIQECEIVHKFHLNIEPGHLLFLAALVAQDIHYPKNPSETENEKEWEEAHERTSGTYTDLRKHARTEHPCVRPSEADPERQRNWRRKRAANEEVAVDSEESEEREDVEESCARVKKYCL